MKRQPNELHLPGRQLRELHLFAGAGGGVLGGILCGHTCVCAVEIEPYPRKVLLQRQRDGILPRFPIWDDVRTFDGKPWRGKVDIVCGGFPCQDISAAGKGAGLSGERSGLWKEMGRIINEIRPRYVLVENSPVLTSRGLGVVLGDLAAMGFDAQWGVLGASDAGAPHKRERIWVMAHAKSARWGSERELQRPSEAGRIFGERSHLGPMRASQVAPFMADTNGVLELQQEGGKQEQRGRTGNRGATVSNTRSERGQLSAERQLTAIEQPWSDSEARSSGGIAGQWWATEPDVGRVAHGVACRVDRLKAIGNGQVPQVAALAWETLKPK
jgi:DNA (cytosine-5)-methyltransferase 1